MSKWKKQREGGGYVKLNIKNIYIKRIKNIKTQIEKQNGEFDVVLCEQ